MTRALTARRERATERLQKQVESWHRRLNDARARLARLAESDPSYGAAEAKILVIKKKLDLSCQTLANTRANLTLGSKEAKQHVREQTLQQTAALRRL